MMLAQAKATIACHEMVSGGQIGPAPNIALGYAATPDPHDVLAADNFNAIRNWLYLDAGVHGYYNTLAWSWLESVDATPQIEASDMEILQAAKPDFIAINYYNTSIVGLPREDGKAAEDSDQQILAAEPGVYEPIVNPYLPRTQFGWEIDPIGFRTTLRAVWDRYRLPILVTENGLGAYDKLENGRVRDQYRIDYLRLHIEQMRLAITDGMEVIGYNPWSAKNLISTHEGMRKQYGFIYVNRTDEELLDLARYPKDSFYWYQRVIATNGADLSNLD